MVAVIFKKTQLKNCFIWPTLRVQLTNSSFLMWISRISHTTSQQLFSKSFNSHTVTDRTQPIVLNLMVLTVTTRNSKWFMNSS